MLAYGFEPTIRGWVRMRMGSAPQDVDDVVMEVLQSALREAVAFARLASPDLGYSIEEPDESMPEAPASPGTAPQRDEIDELFTGG